MYNIPFYIENGNYNLPENSSCYKPDRERKMSGCGGGFCGRLMAKKVDS